MTALRLLLALSALIALPAQALDYRSVAVPAAILYDAPSTLARKLFVIGRGYPVEVVVSVDNWLKVRDSSGALAWVEAAKLATTGTRMLVVTAAQAEIRAAAQDGAAITARVEKGVLLEWQETLPGGWARVRLPDNSSGYIKLSQVWGA
ncbi:MAG TPA: SH3 domain-containing protein [Sulfuriferula sp.]|nr:SH3 domain-containing protein [Sulfuriferula sp.]